MLVYFCYSCSFFILSLGNDFLKRKIKVFKFDRMFFYIGNKYRVIERIGVY